MSYQDIKKFNKLVKADKQKELQSQRKITNAMYIKIKYS